MTEYLAVAGILSAAALFLREVRLLIAEVRRWIKPTPPRKPRNKKEPPA
jgi:hypothetical protein